MGWKKVFGFKAVLTPIFQFYGLNDSFIHFVGFRSKFQRYFIRFFK